MRSDTLFSYVSCEARVPKDHPLRPIRQIVDEALAALSPEFEQLYAKFGRPSIPPERSLRALLLQAFYSVRSELPQPPAECRQSAGLFPYSLGIHR
jgi:transposase